MRDFVITSNKLKGLILFNFLIYSSLILILYIPISGVPYVLDSLSGDFDRIIRRLGANSNIELTLLRDVLFLFVTILFILSFFFKPLKLKYLLELELAYKVFISFILISFFISLIYYPFAVPFSGVRVFQSILTIILFYYISKFDISYSLKYYQTLIIVFLIVLFVCFLQTQFMLGYEGSTFFGSRVIGTFNNPNTVGAFFAFIFMFFLFFRESKFYVSLLFCILAIYGILMSGSRAAISIASFLLMLHIWIKLKNFYLKILYILALPVLLVLVYLILPILSGRERMISVLDDPRWNILFSIFNERSIFEVIFGSGIGYGSNTLNSITNSLPKIFSVDKGLVTVTDSTISLLLLQFGIVGILMYVLTIISFTYKMGYKGMAISSYIIILGISNVWFEMYPINLLVCSLIGITYNKKL